MVEDFKGEWYLPQSENMLSTDIISESLGHQNLAITQAYLKSFSNSVLDEAIKVLL